MHRNINIRNVNSRLHKPLNNSKASEFYATIAGFQVWQLLDVFMIWVFIENASVESCDFSECLICSLSSVFFHFFFNFSYILYFYIRYRNFFRSKIFSNKIFHTKFISIKTPIQNFPYKNFFFNIRFIHLNSISNFLLPMAIIYPMNSIRTNSS